MIFAPDGTTTVSTVQSISLDTARNSKFQGRPVHSYLDVFWIFANAPALTILHKLSLIKCNKTKLSFKFSPTHKPSREVHFPICTDVLVDVLYNAKRRQIAFLEPLCRRLHDTICLYFKKKPLLICKIHTYEWLNAQLDKYKSIKYVNWFFYILLN